MVNTALGVASPDHRLVRRGLVTAAALLAAALFSAPTARAGDEFEDAFKFELGRIAAHEAVSVGRAVLVGGFPYPYGHYPYYGAYYGTPYYYPYFYGHYGHHRHHYGGHGYGHFKHHRGHHGHHGHHRRHGRHGHWK